MGSTHFNSPFSLSTHFLKEKGGPRYTQNGRKGSRDEVEELQKEEIDMYRIYTDLVQVDQIYCYTECNSYKYE